MKATIILLTLCVAVPGFASDDWTVESKYGDTYLFGLSVTNASVSEAINLVINKCITTRADGHGPGVILNADKDPSISDCRIHLVTNGVLVLDALRVIAEQAGLEFTTEDHAVILRSKRRNNEGSNQALEAIGDPRSPQPQR